MEIPESIWGMLGRDYANKVHVSKTWVLRIELESLNRLDPQELLEHQGRLGSLLSG